MISRKKFIVCFMFFLCIAFVGCSSKNIKNSEMNSTKNMNLIYKEVISPNEEFIENEDDIVKYIVEIYQDKNKNILVNASSNSKLFKPLQQEIECDKSISDSDIIIEWTTLMGNTTPKKDDQFGVAHITIFSNGKEIRELTINFVNRGIEIIEKAIHKNN